jgi:imidazolonepropionase-like amidohydrolase
MKKLFVLALLGMPYFALAQTTQKYLIKTGKLFDSEAGKFKTGLDVLVDGNKIEAVKADNDVTADEKKGREFIDLSKYTILPGLIDSHTHLLFREELQAGMDFSTLSLEKVLTQQGDAYRAIYGAVRARAYLEAGITSVQDLGNSGKFADIALRKAIEDGLVVGPRMSCAGQGLSSEGGQLPGLIYQHRAIANDEYRIITGADDATQAVRENVTQGANVIKIYSNNTPNRTALSVDEMRAIVAEAHRYHIRVTAHATDNQSVYNAVIAGVDGVEHGYQVNDSTLMLMAQKKVVLVPTDGDSTIFANYAKIAYPGEKNVALQLKKMQNAQANRLQRALKYGVTIAAGSDDYIDVHMPYSAFSKHTLIGYNEEGISIPQILQFATINAAKQLNMPNRIGKLKQGFFADIIAVDSNIDADIHAIMNVHFVMKDGVVYVNK